MPSQGPLFPGTISLGGDGDIDWGSTESNAASNNATFAETYWGSAGSAVSYAIVATNYGFTIPSGATIDGIQVTVDRFQGSVEGDNGEVSDATVKLVKSGTITGNNKANTVDGSWPYYNAGSYSPVTYGGPSDTWGVSGGFTDTQINASNFGAAVAAALVSDGVDFAEAYIDYVAAITVHYTEASGIVLPIFHHYYVGQGMR